MKKINLLIIILSLFLIQQTIAQEKIIEKRDYKFFGSSYNQEDLILRRVNDTLNIFFENEKKISYFWSNVGEFENFPGFEKHVDSFFEMTNQIGLDFENKNYYLRYSPETSQLIYEELTTVRFKKENNQTVPIHRHTVRFTPRGMTDIEVYLGEIDELLVLKDAGITEIVRNLLLEEGWFKKYEKRLFNKDLIIRENGEKEIISYHNLEGIERLELNIDVGPRFLGTSFPLAGDFTLLLNLGKLRKWSGVSDAIELSYTTFSFFSNDEDSGFNFKNDHFINLGYRTNLLGMNWTMKYGRSLGRSDSFFENYKNRMAFDYQFHPKFKITLESIFKDFKSDGISSVGISYRLF